ncbi:MIP transporter [Lentithecium fluviatile CBS 122367]|uniref:MIP transporter n=1 Tax=Lentithecium fluviatile CBS 122367 TaxID=1168545 RepID=A0A6G1JE00_9PLEO|nr:MIP transporter [Lentithecium fluviatile CBS 122367]
MAAPEDVEQAGFQSENEIRQRKTADSRTPSIASRPFAGRIGGNQEFTLSPSDSDFGSVISKQPDAAAAFTWKQSLGLRGFADVELWKQATIEGVGTCLQIYLSGLYSIGLAPAVTETSLGPITPAVLGSLANVLLVSLFIFSAGPVSGGHLNPLITMSTFAARLSAFPRTLLYIAFQYTGSVVAGFLVRVSLGAPPASFHAAPGCYIDPGMVTPGQTYALETMSSFALILIAFGVGLDPRQRDVFGPALSPILVGLAQGLCTFASSFARAGYAGASLNPARCLGLMAAAECFSYHYIHWVGGMTAALLNGLMYWAIPIYKERTER